MIVGQNMDQFSSFMSSSTKSTVTQTHHNTTLIPYGILLKTEFLISVSSAWQQQSAALLFLLRLALGYTFWNLFGLEK